MKRKFCNSFEKFNFSDEFPTGEAFILSFSSSKALEIVSNERQCIFGRYPTLAEINTIYMGRVAEQWLAKEFMDMEKYFFFSKRLDKFQLAELSQHIYKKYNWLKVSELLLFLWKCKDIEFGEFFGMVDSQRILVFLNEYMKSRKKLIDEVMEEIEQKYLEWHRQNAVQKRTLDDELKKIPSGMENTTNRALPTVCEKEAILRSAMALVNNVHGYDVELLDKMCASWEKKYGCLPQEYINGTKGSEKI